MLKRDDWGLIFFWAGMVLVLLGASIDAIIDYEITLEKIITPIRQVEWSWGLRVAVVGFAILMIILILMIIDMKKRGKKQ